MRTITEFFGMSLKSAAEKIPGLTEEATKSAQETMKAEGKTEEEMTAGLPAAAKAALDAKIGETFKLEGEKLAMFAAALDIYKDARGNVKRIIVMAKAKEDEKAPSSAKEIDGKFYAIETFPEPARAAPREERGGKFGDKKGGKFGDKKGGKGDRGGKSGGRPARAPRPDAAGFTPVTGTIPGGRPARAPRAPVEPYKGPNRIGVKSATPSAPATPSEPSSSNE